MKQDKIIGQKEFLDVSKQVEKDRNSNVNHIKKQGYGLSDESDKVNHLIFKTRVRKYAPLPSLDHYKPKKRKQMAAKKRTAKKLLYIYTQKPIIPKNYLLFNPLKIS